MKNKGKQTQEIVLVDDYGAQKFMAALQHNGYRFSFHKFVTDNRQYVLIEWEK